MTTKAQNSAEIMRGADVPENPRVSVIIPAWGVAPYIAETLKSVFAQTFTAYEVVLVNDGSPDTAEFEREIAPFRNRLVYVKKANGGAASARNAGIRAASGELIAFLDGDDIWQPHFLESQINFIEQSGFEMVYADARFFGENVQGEQTYMQFSISEGAVTTESLLTWTCNVITSGTVVYRDKIVEAGFFDESPDWRRGQDFEMWFRLAKNNVKIGYQRDVLLQYRVRETGLSGNAVKTAERNVTVLKGIKKKYALAPNEEAAWQKMMRLSEAMWRVECGKAALREGDFQKAREHFALSTPLYSKTKAAVLDLALRIAPRVVQKVIGGRGLATSNA
jgi:teichuronic acid biosynthesis glycosyltransferase TuaG